MIATPCGPSAVPTGGAGVAPPAGIWILTTAVTFFLAMRELSCDQLEGRSSERFCPAQRICTIRDPFGRAAVANERQRGRKRGSAVGRPFNLGRKGSVPLATEALELRDLGELEL